MNAVASVGPGERAERTSTLIQLAITLVIAAIGFGLGGLQPPQLIVVAPISFFSAALGDAGTAGVLWATWRHVDGRRSQTVLILTFAIASILTFLSLLIFPNVPGRSAILAVGPQSGTWVYLVIQTVRIVGAIGYAVIRRSFDGPSVSLPSRIGAIALVIAILAALALACTTTILPAGITVTTTIPLFAAGLLAAAYALTRVPRPTPFDRAYAISLLALAIDAVMLAHGPRFSMAYYGSHILLMYSALLVFIGGLQSLVRSRAQLSAIEARLTTSQSEAALAAGRIRALWQIASDRSAFETENFQHILRTATESLRPGMPLVGVLSHLDNELLVIDATASTLVGVTAASHENVIRAGATFPFEGTALSLIRTAGRTSVWRDVDFEKRGLLAETLGIRSVIGTPIIVARRTLFLTFASPEPVDDEPFGEDDIAFVDVVASFIASHFTQQMQIERIQFQIEHDALTGLENRVQFRRHVRAAIASGHPFAVAFANLDDFRLINEHYGHQIGDEILVEVAAGLRSIDEGTTVARMSGDEFGIILPGAGSIEATVHALSRYTDLFRRPFHTGDRDGKQRVSIGAAIGASRFPEDGRTVEELMVRSDAALTSAKQQSGTSAVLFDRRMEAMIQQENARVTELREGVAAGQLALVYQPTFELATAAIIGAEALVRWDHPERGRLQPVEFIRLAERHGVIEQLSLWVLQQLVTDLASCERLPTGFRVSFNVAANLLENFPFISRCREILFTHPRIVHHIGVEVTETAAMQNLERSMNTIDLFRRWGLSVAIDDFGTGYSSLSYLKQLKADVIKIDKSFVDGLPSDDASAALADMLIRLTDRFGLTTLAEGIETQAQATWLLDHGCRLGQGYLVARPASFEDLLARIA
jgi:diguanylate cyclase (GGDEF)-like protein